MHNKNEQDSHLAGLITMKEVKRRRPRNRNNNVDRMKPHSAGYGFKIRYEGKEIEVCKEAFLSIHGITLGRLRRIQNHMVTHGTSPRDLRGKDKQRSTDYPDTIIHLIETHIKTFKPRQSHYSRRKNPLRFYLPEGLTIKEMHSMFLTEHLINIPYKIYWKIFTTKFNIKFGFPRSDTCAQCDSFQQKLTSENISDAEKVQLTMEKEIHLRKAEAFFTLKKRYQTQAKAGEIDCISFDFMQNLPLPHIPSNPVFYSRQLWYHVFGIHNLGTDEAHIYTYTEGQARKGANDVCSMLLYFINNNNFATKNLVLISDGCPGQNKNYVMLHFLFILVHVLKIFDKITYLFPVRGHSFLPNDQDFALIERKKRRLERVETPEEWDKVILSARSHPSKFSLVKMDPSKMFDIKSATDQYFLKTAKPPISLKQVRMFQISTETVLVKLRDTYTGPWRSSIVRSKIRMTGFIQLTPLYLQAVPISSAKLKNLKSLLPFLGNARNRSFYDDIFSQQDPQNKDTGVEIEEEDNSSGCDEPQ